MALTAGCRPPPSAHMHTQTQTQPLNSPCLCTKFLWNVFIFTPQYIAFKHNIQTPLFKHPPQPLHVPCRTPCSLCSLLSLHPPLVQVRCQECRHLPMPVVMILSVRLVSCQTHRIYSGLFLMLTLMFLFFTRKEGNGSVLKLLSTNTLYKLLSNKGNW